MVISATRTRTNAGGMPDIPRLWDSSWLGRCRIASCVGNPSSLDNLGLLSFLVILSDIQCQSKKYTINLIKWMQKDILSLSVPTSKRNKFTAWGKVTFTFFWYVFNLYTKQSLLEIIWFNPDDYRENDLLLTEWHNLEYKGVCWRKTAKWLMFSLWLIRLPQKLPHIPYKLEKLLT